MEKHPIHIFLAHHQHSQHRPWIHPDQDEAATEDQRIWRLVLKSNVINFVFKNKQHRSLKISLSILILWFFFCFVAKAYSNWNSPTALSKTVVFLKLLTLGVAPAAYWIHIFALAQVSHQIPFLTQPLHFLPARDWQVEQLTPQWLSWFLAHDLNPSHKDKSSASKPLDWHGTGACSKIPGHKFVRCKSSFLTS